MNKYNRGIVILYEDLCDNWIEWLKQSELTTLGVHKLAIPGQKSLDTLLESLDLQDGRKIIDAAQDAGIAVEYELHAMEWLMPREHFHDHPEWFRQNDKGERTNDLNLCPSSTEALDILSENTFRLAKMLRQSSDNYFLWLDDAFGGICECDSCREKSSADKYITVLKAMLRGLKAYNPNARLSYLAYASILDAPTIDPGDSIFLEFAPMDRNHFKPINSPDEERGTNYMRALDKLLKVFKAEDTHVLEYWLDNALYSGYRRPPVRVPFDSNVMDADVSEYCSRGIRSIKTFGSMIDTEYCALYGNPPITEYGQILKKYIH